GNAFLRARLVRHLEIRLELVEASVLLLQLLLEIDQGSESELRRPLQVAVAFCAFELASRRLDLGLERADAVDPLLLLVPVGLHARARLLEIGQLPFGPLQSLERGGTVLLRECG